jgi:hypothetical protein
MNLSLMSEEVIMALVKLRTLNLQGKFDAKQTHAFMDELLDKDGVIEASLDTAQQKLHFTYDLEKINLKRIEHVLKHSGYHLSSSWLSRIKRHWLYYTEENELENYNAPAQPCCSHPDEHLKKAQHL